VTRLDIGRGVVDREFRVAYLAARAWSQTGGFAIDTIRNRSYATWEQQPVNPASAAVPAPDQTCYIPRTDAARTGHDFITYTGACGQASSLLAVDQLNGNVVTADPNELRVFSGKSGKEIAAYSLVDPTTKLGSTWLTSATIYRNRHCYVALVGDVNYYNDATGALTQGAAEFVPIP
jgi:hypothetical protein